MPRFRQAELLNAIPNLIAIDPEQVSGLRLIASGALQRLNHQLTLHGLEVDNLRRKAERCRCRRFRQRGEVLDAKQTMIGEQHRPFDRIAKLAHVARPTVLIEHRLGTWLQAAHTFAELAVVAVDVVRDEQTDVADALT